MSYVGGQLIEIPTPETGYGTVVPKTDGELYYKDDLGVETQITNAGTSITGSRADTEAALANLLTALAAQGLIIDNTTA